MIYSDSCPYIPLHRCFHLWGTISSNSLGNPGLSKHSVGHQQTRLGLKFLVGSLLLSCSNRLGPAVTYLQCQTAIDHSSVDEWGSPEFQMQPVKHNCPPAQKNGTICQQWSNTAPLWRDLAQRISSRCFKVRSYNYVT